ncbi:MAG: hypothetical protein R3F13_07130 [Prosthecobacter sp.]
MKTNALLFSLALLACGITAQGQNDDDFFPELGLLTTVGTTATVNTESWAYLLWQTDDADLLLNKIVAVYRKSGAGSFVRVAVTKPQPDPRVISSLQPRAQMLGEDLDELDHGITAIYQDVIPAGTLTLPQKLSAVIQGTQTDADKRESMGFLARCHPLVAMSLGQALADRLPAPGVFTYELREFNALSNQDIRVLGRVTVDTAAGVTLPAPGQPAEVIPADAKIREGHLAAMLRWATPEALRDRSTMLAGYNVYRVEKAFAEDGARQWHITPPTAAALRAALGAGVTRVNEPLVTPDKVLDDAQANDANDHETFFVTDDNRRFEEGGTAFNDGNEFYYFVSGADILCRDGLVSPGRLVTIHDRLAPLPPRDVRVTNEVAFSAGSRSQHLRVRWPRANDPDSSIAEYHVYRWSSIEEIAQFRADPTARRIGIVPHHPATTEFMLDDTGAGAPRHPPENGQPDVSGTLFFYTVRAVDASSAGGNMSRHSAPARGILRTAEGPAAPTGEVLIRCYDPVVAYASISPDPVADLPDNLVHLQLICGAVVQRSFEWAEFRIGDGVVTAAELLGRVYFGREGTASQIANLFVSRDNWPGTIHCRAATRGGKVSDWVPANITPPSKSADVRFKILFTASLQQHDEAAGGPCGTIHISREPGSGDRVPICVTATPTEGSRELRVYRRVDDGPLTLMSVQELADDSTPVIEKDDAVPAGSAQVCFYLQVIDVDGHASALVPAGPCVRTINDEELPVPRLLRPEPEAGPAGAPRMRLRWACVPHGVERFELWISRRNNTPQTTFAGSGLSGNLASPGTRLPEQDDMEFGIYQTVLASQVTTEENGAVFTALLPVTTIDTYDVTVRAVGPGTFDGGRSAGAFSNFGRFLWNSIEVGGGINVPWPARPLPVARAATAFHPNIAAAFLSNIGGSAWKGVGIRVGEYEYRGANQEIVNGVPSGTKPPIPPYVVPGQSEPSLLLYREVLAGDNPSRLLWPLVLYRVQLTGTNQPATGDTTQASPLMENIAHEFTLSGADPVTIVHDPYIAVVPRQGPPAQGSTHDIYLLDRNPIIKGARYQYLLVRMGADSEPEEVLATQPVNIPLNP